MYKLSVFSNFKLKEMGIKLFIGGYSRNYIQGRSLQFYEKITYHKKVLKEMILNIESGNNVIISSASFQEYLSIFQENNKNILLSSSILKYKNNKVVGLEVNNYGEEKLKYFRNYTGNIDILYTDSFSDRFLAKLANKIFIVFGNENLVKLDSYQSFSDFFNKEV